MKGETPRRSDALSSTGGGTVAAREEAAGFFVAALLAAACAAPPVTAGASASHVATAETAELPRADRGMRSGIVSAFRGGAKIPE